MKTKVLRTNAKTLTSVLSPLEAERQARSAVDFNLASLRQVLSHDVSLSATDLAEVANGLADLVAKVQAR